VETICLRIPPPVEPLVVLRAVTNAIGETWSAQSSAGAVAEKPGTPPGTIRPADGGIWLGSSMAPSPSPSPVLGSDELYSAAGWVDDGRRAESGAGPGLPAGGAAAAGERGGAVSVGEAADSLARGGWRAEPFARSSWSEESEAGLAESSDEEDAGLALGGGGGGGAEGQALREVADEDAVARRMGALVSQSIELEPRTVFAPTRLPIDRRAAAELGWAGSPRPERGGGADVPCSLSEIYRLSNLNKRRSKQRTRLQSLLAATATVADGSDYSAEAESEDSDFETELALLRPAGGASGGAVEVAGSDAEGESGGARQSFAADVGGGGGAAEGHLAFMERIGWLPPGGLTPRDDLAAATGPLASVEFRSEGSWAEAGGSAAESRNSGGALRAAQPGAAPPVALGGAQYGAGVAHHYEGCTPVQRGAHACSGCAAAAQPLAGSWGWQQQPPQQLQTQQPLLQPQQLQPQAGQVAAPGQAQRGRGRSRVHGRKGNAPVPTGAGPAFAGGVAGGQRGGGAHGAYAQQRGGAPGCAPGGRAGGYGPHQPPQQPLQQQVHAPGPRLPHSRAPARPPAGQPQQVAAQSAPVAGAWGGAGPA
ncbi:hypothetical protein T492DRAFT_885896, partial [Pavlovales sp. CCMP2436]